MSTFCGIGLHAGENAKPVFQHQTIPFPAAHRGKIAVEPGKLESIEMLGKAKGVQTGPAGLTEKPIGVSGGKRQLFGQLAMGMKIQLESI